MVFRILIFLTLATTLESFAGSERLADNENKLKKTASCNEAVTVQLDEWSLRLRPGFRLTNQEIVYGDGFDTIKLTIRSGVSSSDVSRVVVYTIVGVGEFETYKEIEPLRIGGLETPDGWRSYLVRNLDYDSIKLLVLENDRHRVLFIGGKPEYFAGSSLVYEPPIIDCLGPIRP